MRVEDEIWNRACAAAGGSKSLTAPGDRALADMVLVHSLAMNGGVLHAIESLAPDEREAGAEGYRYFGLGEVANIIEDLARRLADVVDDDMAERLEIEADERYAAVIARDEVLVQAFAERYRQEPAAFAAP